MDANLVLYVHTESIANVLCPQELLFYYRVTDNGDGMVLGHSAPYSREAEDVAIASVIDAPLSALRRTIRHRTCRSPIAFRLELILGSHCDGPEPRWGPIQLQNVGRTPSGASARS